MKRKLFLLIIVILAAAAASSAQLKPVPGDERPADRDAIVAHLDKIFQGFIHQDPAALRAGHAEHWVGFLQGSRTLQKGIDRYMQENSGAMTSPGHLTSYKILDIDITFYGDVALVPYDCEIEIAGPNFAPHKRKLRIFDVFAKLNGEWIQVGTDTAAHPDTQLADMGQLQTPGDADKKQLLDAREAVWRAFFANDRAALETMLPAETVAISPGSDAWSNRDEILADAGKFAASGGKLVRLEFPRTDVQIYGVTAIVYSTYEYELELGGNRSVHSGRATETFVLRGGRWVNSGWHLDSGSGAPRAAAQ